VVYALVDEVLAMVDALMRISCRLRVNSEAPPPLSRASAE